MDIYEHLQTEQRSHYDVFFHINSETRCFSPPQNFENFSKLNVKVTLILVVSVL